MTNLEYREAYPDRAYLLDLPRVPDPSGRKYFDKRSGKSYIHYGLILRCEDCNCKYPEVEHFVEVSNIVRDKCGDGLYRCSSCSSRYTNKFITDEGRRRGAEKRSESMDFSSASRKAMETLGPEGLSKRAHKVAESQKQNGTGFFSYEAHVKSYNTRKENGTFLRSLLELDIEKEFGGQHSSPEFRYELDIYWPWLSKGVEVDDKTHVDKRLGYHKEKDDYFKSLGIEVLHISLSPNASRRPHYEGWKDLVEAFLMDELPRKYFYMGDDPYHING